MSVEDLVLQAAPEDGPLAHVSAPKLNKSWETLQEALDELGQHEWDLCTTIYSTPDERTALALAPLIVLLGAPFPLFAGQGLLGLADRQGLPFYLLARQ